jgi:dual specificity phosphatase 12
VQVGAFLLCPRFAATYSSDMMDRRTLATSQYILSHTTSTTCAHYFVDPLSWMRPELEQSKLDGRLECPKCKTNVGKYAWQGMRCSCGDWIVPGISLAKGRIDQVKSRTTQGSLGIRVPPAATGSRGPGQGNL